MKRYYCCDDARRQALRTDDAALNGIDYVEVIDREAPTQALRQRIIHVYFLNARHLGELTGSHFRIEGGEHVCGIRVM